MKKSDILGWYRRLYRNSLRAVQFSSPSRYVVRDQLRAAFRRTDEIPDKHTLQRTNWFLQTAAAERGLEHKILKNLIRMAQDRSRLKPWKSTYLQGVSHDTKPLAQANKAMDESAHYHFDMTLAMLNKSMGMCLRCDPTYEPR
ncbi:mitochondrial carrier protein [Colletotrichum karsti]|uniref:Mitochondrial carrier protein n=1 Tax=Colletotrichum karsti TaxID=1095194 RepID=A0A9P6HTW6_9PEZI|nr:mitochondrial carrier protein [Colletotrichum karsti]KAF9870129.1 mitochondrial carrier protein [Colletotrichum karsti]